MKRRTFTYLFLIVLTAFMNCAAFAEEQKPLYQAGPWSGKVIDADTKQPVEGAVVSFVWYRDYDTRFTVMSSLHEAKEVLTDKDGYFEIPVYTETGENKKSWPKPQLQGIETPDFFIIGPIIRDPDIVIYKPGYNYFPMKPAVVIFATKPAVVEYQEFYTKIVKGETIGGTQKSTMSFPEGLVYFGSMCAPAFERLIDKADYKFGSVFYKTDNAKERLRKFDVPIGCPKKAEAIPLFISGYKYEIENALKIGGFMIIGLSKTASDEERFKEIPKVPDFTSPDRLPNLFKFINDETVRMKAIKEELEKKKLQEQKK